MNTQRKQPKRDQNPFESIAEFGVSSVKQVVDTLNPLSSILEHPSHSSSPAEKAHSPENQKPKGHTPLDFNKLGEKYKNQDESVHQQELASLRQRYFKRIKNEDEQLLQEHHNKDQEKLKQEAYEEQVKQQQIQERLAKQQQQDEPHGKIRKNILGGGKRKADISREVAYENKGQRGR